MCKLRSLKNKYTDKHKWAKRLLICTKLNQQRQQRINQIRFLLLFFYSLGLTVIPCLNAIWYASLKVSVFSFIFFVVLFFAISINSLRRSLPSAFVISVLCVRFLVALGTWNLLFCDFVITHLLFGQLWACLQGRFTKKRI